jgi:hypothetical protein
MFTLIWPPQQAVTLGQTRQDGKATFDLYMLSARIAGDNLNLV